MKNMRLFYEAWNFIESNSPIGIGELTDKTTIAVEDSSNLCNNETDTIRQLQLTNLPDFPLTEFLSISFTHHVRILENAKAQGADTLITACPLCFYNLKKYTDGTGVEVRYLTDVLAEALGVKEEG